MKEYKVKIGDDTTIVFNSDVREVVRKRKVKRNGIM